MSARALLLCLAAGSCGPPRAAPAPPSGPVVARVDGEAITEDAVRAAAAREGVDAPTALQMLVDEALLAREASRRGLAEPWVEEDARWHATLRRYLEARVEAPVTLANAPAGAFDAYFDSRRAALCHDGLRTVVHFVVLSERDARPAGAAMRAQEAATLRREIVAAGGERPSRAVFERVAGARASEALHVEPLPPIDRHGGMANGGAVVGPFAQAVWRLSEDAPLSPPFETSFGVHVALLVGETPPSGVSCESVRPRLETEFVAMRRASVASGILERLRARAVIRVDYGALQASEGPDAP
ncbi:MAG: hypothetical protein R3A48_14885 [Polyangiales bacterium]